MKEKVAKRMISGAATNLMGKLHDLSGKPGYYSFASGMPNELSFPIEEMSRAVSYVLDNQWELALQYNSTEDYAPLKDAIVARYQKAGLEVAPEDILITSSSTQALDICAKTFLDTGDTILVERPSFMGAINTFKMYQANIIGVRLDENGVDTADLKAQLAKRPKMAYFIPTFQNPTGFTHSYENRIRTAEAFAGTGVIVLEDDPYGELRFEGEPIPPLKKFVGDQCILLGSFSKIVSPGMRLGWICCTDPEMMRCLRTVKQQCDFHAEGISMRAMCRYFETNDVDAHIAAVTEFYKRNADAMARALARAFPPEVRFYKPKGGFFFWGELPEYIGVGEMFDAASKENVIFFPGTTFFADEREGEHCFRLSYSCTDIASIDTGIDILGKILTELVRKNKGGSK